MSTKLISFVCRLAMLALLAAAPARAQDEATMTQARRFVEAMQMDRTIRSVMPQITQQITTMLTAQNPAIKGDLDAMWPKFMDEMILSLDVFRAAMAKLYASKFSKEELTQLADFFSTPVGRSFAEKQGEIALESMKAGEAWGKAIMPGIIEKLKGELRGKGHRI